MDSILIQGTKKTSGAWRTAFSDISENVRMVEALRESEEKLKTLFDILPIGISILGSDRNIRWNNPAARTILDLTQDDLQDKNYSRRKYLRGDGMEMPAEELPSVRALNEGQPVENVEVGILKEDGECIWSSVSAIPLSLADWAVVIAAVDITKRKQAEKDLAAAQTFASLGTMSAGIAHEINSPLQVITGLSERIMVDLQKGKLDSQTALKDIETINRNAWRIANIVRSLLVYINPGMRAHQFCDLATLVDEVVNMTEFQMKIRNNISVVKEVAQDMPQCACDSAGINQVLIKLLNNAVDAMPQGGQITIHAGYDAKKRQFLLQITDTGHGILAEDLPKVFDPFYTTRGIGQGLGLGLSVSQSIIQAYGGKIKVESTPSKGATFTICLPETPPHAAESNAGTGRYKENL